MGVLGKIKMPERIIKNKKVSECKICINKITTDYKVKWKAYEGDKRSKYYHLSCYHNHILGGIKIRKTELKELNKAKRKLKKFVRFMILENLEK